MKALPSSYNQMSNFKLIVKLRESTVIDFMLAFVLSKPLKGKHMETNNNY